jgi:hypothetical protein
MLSAGFSYGFPMIFIVFPWFSYGFLWFSYDFPGFPMGVPWFNLTSCLSSQWLEAVALRPSNTLPGPQGSSRSGGGAVRVFFWDKKWKV